MALILLLIVLLSVLSLTLSLSDKKNAPEQIHIALAGNNDNGDSDKMTVSWQTKKNTKTTIIKYGLESGLYSYNATGMSSSYYETFDHHVKTDTLKPNTKYFFVVGDDEDGFSDERSFTSALTSDTRGFSFAVFADMGVVNGKFSNNYLSQIKDQIDLVWHGGDVGYADDAFLHPGCYIDFCYEKAFNDYMNMIEPWASVKPYMVAVGNHEADCHDPNCLVFKSKHEKLSNFTAYNSRFLMPSEESEGVMNMHYSFNYANVHFISIDTETGYPGAAEETKYVFPCGGFGGGKFESQLAWLEADLVKANADRATRPWIFVQGHHPMYQGSSVNTEFQAAMEDLFYKYGVDIYFSGHVHSYERDLPVYKSVPESSYTNPRATTYLMIGGSGNDEMKDAQRKLQEKFTPNNRELGSKWTESDSNGPWTAVTDMDGHVGIGKVTIMDDSNLRFDYIRTSSGEVYDTITLTRDHSSFN